MKKYLFLVLALLLTFGVANVYATNIPAITDPQHYPTVWTELVYNGSGSTIQSAYIVEWDFDTCDVDNAVYDKQGMWVKLGATAGGVWTAGVVPLGQNIANGDVGRIVIRGPTVVAVKNGTTKNTVTVNTLVANDNSPAGIAVDEVNTAVDSAVLGVVIKVDASAADVGGDATSDMALIYVNPTYYENGT